MSTIDRLASMFERFPGIGPRQARRFVFHLLTEPKAELNELAKLIGSVKESVFQCPSCFRFHTVQNDTYLCEICSDSTRDNTLLMIVERDSDIRPVERSNTFMGKYFVFGGTVPLVNDGEITRVRSTMLKKIVGERIVATPKLCEVILAFSVNPDGENTARYIETLIRDEIDAGLTITTLGRGLSTGSELEYADTETIKNALRNRG
jgi:recombination protein RecR